MSDENLQDRSAGASPTEQPDPAEAKRLAVRRRFLKRGAAGSGVAVLTFYHTKGYAGKGKKVILSSTQACLSIGGSPGTKPVKVQDSVVPYVYDAKGHKHKNMVERTECTLK